MKRPLRILLALAAALAGALAIGVTTAYADHLCGTTITEDTKLTHDQDCSGNGITIGKSGITLDLDWNEIDGNSSGIDYGVIINGHNHIKIKNGTIKDHYDGVRSGSAMPSG